MSTRIEGYVTQARAAELLDISRERVRQLVRAGKLAVGEIEGTEGNPPITVVARGSIEYRLENWRTGRPPRDE